MNIKTRLVRRVSLIALLAVIVLPGIGLAQPVVSSFGFTPPTIDTGSSSTVENRTVNVTFSITDATSTPSYFEVAFLDPTGVFVQRGTTALSSSGPGSVSVTFPPFSIAGTWKVLGVFAADAAGNTTLLDTAALAARPFPTDLVVTSAIDTTPPNITSFAFSPASIDTTATDKNVTVTFTATDNLAKVASVYAGFVNPNGGTARGTRVNAPADFTAGVSVSNSLVVNFPRGSEAGIWKVSFINVVDTAGNTLYLDTAAAAALFPTAQNLEVITTTDTTAPNLSAFNVTTSGISTNGGPVTVNFTVTDDLSGATDFQIAFQSPSGNQLQTQSGGIAFAPNTSFSGNVIVNFPPGTEAGTWTTASIFLADARGNTRSINQAISLTVTEPGTDVTPPVLTPTVTPIPNGSGWNNTTPVTVTWTVADPESGITSSTGCEPAPLSATGNSPTCMATNGVGLSSSAFVMVKIDTAPPVTTNALATPNPVALGADLTISATLNDAGGSNIASAEFKVNDGPFDDLAAVDGDFDESTENVALLFPGSHPLLVNPGVHTICVRGTDVAGNVGATECVIVAVHGVNSTTGGGGTNSPAGADTANPTGSGPVTYGFVSKYLPGDTFPSGNFTFRYPAGNLDFKQTSYQVMTVTNGNRAVVEGTGTLGGTSVCQFELDAWDGSFTGNVDAFGLRIFNCDGAGVSVNRYNLVATPTTKGNIQVR